MLRNLFKKRDIVHPMDGVRRSSGQTPLKLRSRTIRIEVSRDLFRRFAGWRRGTFLAILLLCIVGLSVGNGKRAAAGAILYPSTCLGGWNNPAKAEGVPELDGSDYSLYSDANSASISDSISQIFCGGFQGTIPPDTTPTKVTLHVSWAVRRTPQETITGASFASSTSAILDASGDTSAVISTDASTNTSTPSDFPPPDVIEPTQDTPTSATDTPAVLPPESSPAHDTPPPDVPPVQDTAPAPDSPQSFMSNMESIFAKMFATQAYAQTESTSTDSTNSLQASSVQVTSASSTASVPTPDGILEVLYTLDGTTWNSIEIVSASELSNTSFDIPVAAIKSWDDISKLQIEVRSLSNADPASTIYLDGMHIDVAYVSQIQEATSTPAAPYLHDGAVLQASDLSTVMVHPVWNDGSTNITFFQDYGNSMTYMAETIGHGDAPLSSYYAPLPGPGKYVMLEYQNDGGNFGCNGISVAQCVQDPHFIARTDFEITDTLLPNDTIATTTATTTS